MTSVNSGQLISLAFVASLFVAIGINLQVVAETEDSSGTSGNISTIHAETDSNQDTQARKAKNPLMDTLTKGNPLMDQLSKNNPIGPLMKPFTDQMASSGMGAIFGLDAGRSGEIKQRDKKDKKRKNVEEVEEAILSKNVGKTTTLSPLEQLTKTLTNPIAMALPGSKLLEGPTQAFNSVIAGPANPVNIATVSLPKVFENTGKIVSSLSGTNLKPRPDDESAYYEIRPGDEPFEYRRPKYFSYDCQFRFACEFGRAMRPITAPFSKGLINNRVFQDMQNRYTRAMTYGSLYDDCERYYCLLIQFVGGPEKFARGVAELVNRVANPEMYDGIMV